VSSLLGAVARSRRRGRRRGFPRDEEEKLDGAGALLRLGARGDAVAVFARARGKFRGAPLVEFTAGRGLARPGRVAQSNAAAESRRGAFDARFRGVLKSGTRWDEMVIPRLPSCRRLREFKPIVTKRRRDAVAALMKGCAAWNGGGRVGRASVESVKTGGPLLPRFDAADAGNTRSAKPAGALRVMMGRGHRGADGRRSSRSAGFGTRRRRRTTRFLFVGPEGGWGRTREWTAAAAHGVAVEFSRSGRELRRAETPSPCAATASCNSSGERGE